MEESLRSNTKIIRVLHVIKTLSLGGAETNLLNLANTFNKKDIETHVAYSFGGEIEQQFRSANVRLFKYADKIHRVKSVATIFIVLRLTIYIIKNRIDIVQTHNFNGHIWGLVAAKISGAKIIEHVHDFRYTNTQELTKRHGLLEQYKFIKFFKGFSDRIVVLTKSDKKFVLENNISTSEKVLEIQNGICIKNNKNYFFKNFRAYLGIKTSDVIVLTSARMDPSKNIDLILRIAARVVQIAPNTIFVVAGNGAYLAEYQERCKKLGLLNSLRFIGFQQDIYSLLADADIFLLPSFLELHSISILEALKMKIPVVVSEGVGCNDEFIENGENGFLCDPFQDDSWIKTLSELSNNKILRYKVGKQGYETCKQLFNIKNTAKKFEEVYKKLIF